MAREVRVLLGEEDIFGGELGCLCVCGVWIGGLGGGWV